MIGTNGWLFYNSDAAGDGHSIDDYEGNVRFTQQEMKNIESNLEHIHTGLAKKGITFVVLVAPNKSTIYDEYLPASIRSKKGVSRYDQLYARLKSNNRLKALMLSDYCYSIKMMGSYITKQTLIGIVMARFLRTRE